MIVVLRDDTFGQNVLFNRIFQNMDPEYIAHMAGISADELEQIESGIQLEIHEDVMAAIAETLNVPLEELLDE